MDCWKCIWGKYKTQRLKYGQFRGIFFVNRLSILDLFPSLYDFFYELFFAFLIPDLHKINSG